MSTPDDDYLDPFDAHFVRAPFPDAPVLIVALSQGEPDRAEAVARSIGDLLAAKRRQWRSLVAECGAVGYAAAVERSLEGATEALVIITTADATWTPEHLDPMLDAINACDHVVGSRRSGRRRRLTRWVASTPWRWVFAVPVNDVHTPYQLHRLSKVASIPLQSVSSFFDVEVLAKATFLGHLIDEVSVPDVRSSRPRVAWADVVCVFRHPEFVRRSIPPEDSKREHEGHDAPEGENGHRGSDVQPVLPLEDYCAERIQKLSQRQGLDEPLH
jgi:hypothetical protein